MRFACERCGKSYATKDVPLPGRIYRIKCKNCGNVLVVKGPDAASSPAQPEVAPAASAWPTKARRSKSASSAVPSAVTPLSDLTAPPDAAAPATSSPASPHPAAPEPHAAPPSAPAASGGYVELFDESDAKELDATPTPQPTQPAAATTPPPIPASPPQGELPPLPPASEEEFRNVAESLRQNLPPDDPFERVRDEFEPVASLADVPLPAAPALILEPRRTPVPAKPEAPPRPPAHRPAARRSHRGMAVAIGSLAVVLVLAGIGFAALRSRPAASRPPPRAATVPRAPAPATSSRPPAARASKPEPPAPAVERAGVAAAVEPKPAAPEPKPAPDETTVAVPITPEPPPAAAAPSPPQRAEAKPPARAHPAPAKKPEKPEKAKGPTKPPERADRTVATAERREAPEPSPAPAPAPAAAQPDADEPSGLTPEQVQRVVGGARRAFDACLRDPWRGLEEPAGSRQITLRFTVAPEGSVNYPTIDDVAISGAPVGQCLKTAARGLTFPSFRGDPVKVDVPITIPVK